MSPPGFTGSPVRRLDPARCDPALLAGLRADPAAGVLRWHDYQPDIADGRLQWDAVPSDATLALLGVVGDAPRFVLLDPAAPPARRTGALMTALGTLAPGEAATYAAARSLADWHARHRFCPLDGAATRPDHAGWARRCPFCGAEHYPRTDPVAIMLACHGTGEDERVLVGRQAAWDPGRYSALAGFVEVGESLEEAVTRELHEEAGVVATRVRYVASQPWPFPSQLMLACLAEVADDRLAIDRSELGDARWVTRAEVRAALAGDPGAVFTPPPAYAIARTLFERWAA